MKNRMYIANNFGWFIGNLNDNQIHKHYAIQLTIPLKNEIVLKTDKEIITTDLPILIQSNVNHQIISNSELFLLLINPASSIGHFWKNLSAKKIEENNASATLELKNILLASQSSSTEKINDSITKYNCFCADAIHKGDDRINTSLIYLSNNFERVVSLKEMADYCNLSESRFLHLFRKETGVSFRRAQLWFKLVKALPLLDKKSFTEISHQVGFADSSHFSRTLKENFGFSPRDFIKLSQFIQV